jgi:hypothetical protein
LALTIASFPKMYPLDNIVLTTSWATVTASPGVETNWLKGIPCQECRRVGSKGKVH